VAHHFNFLVTLRVPGMALEMRGRKRLFKDNYVRPVKDLYVFDRRQTVYTRDA
jgi:hypothetical protein